MSPKILIIDDQAADRKGMAVSLEKDGYSDLLFAATVQEGLDMAYRQMPDIVFIDVVLDKNIDGFDVCKQLRTAGIQSKIIMVTGHLDAVNAKKAVASGANEIIEKIAGYKNLGPAVKAFK